MNEHDTTIGRVDILGDIHSIRPLRPLRSGPVDGTSPTQSSGGQRWQLRAYNTSLTPSRIS
jgi:hypothetical protein